MATVDLSPLEKDLLDITQRDFPLSPRPYATLARRLNVTEEAVLGAFRSLQTQGVVGRIGAVWAQGPVGSSCLAALKVPPARLEAVAATVNAHPEVNHNYERDHPWNLWFVVAARDEPAREAVLDAIAAETGLPLLRLPMEQGHHLDLGFAIDWSAPAAPVPIPVQEKRP